MNKYVVLFVSVSEEEAVTQSIVTDDIFDLDRKNERDSRLSQVKPVSAA